jgi:isoleucyl-tRNA synthetase
MICGHRVHYRPGWDCHGLPIELKVLKDRKTKEKMSPLEIRESARAVAEGTMVAQREEFKSWGITADWDEPYLTMRPEYVKRQLRNVKFGSLRLRGYCVQLAMFRFRLFHEMVERGRLFQRYMPVYWSPSSKTALAESELEYDPNHKSTAVYVSFPMDKKCAEKGGSD